MENEQYYSEYKYKNEVAREMFPNWFVCNHMSASIEKDEDGNEYIQTGYRGCDDGQIPLSSIWHLDEIDDMCKVLMAAKAKLSKSSPTTNAGDYRGECQ